LQFDALQEICTSAVITVYVKQQKTSAAQAMMLK